MSLVLRFVLVVLFTVNCLADAVSQTTFYSRNAGSGGNWNAAASWTLSSDGSGGAASVPGRNDNVVVLNGHTINITAVNNNGSAGVSADGLNRPNVGTFAESGTANFYQIGNVTVNPGGILNLTARAMFAGTTIINGTLNTTLDLINVGNMILNSGATFFTDDDFILTGFSRTLMNNTTNSDDDIYLDHTDARLCGTGTMNVGVNSGNTPTISFSNSATLAQICSGISVTCGPGPGCVGFPTSGSGGFTFNLADFNYYKYLTIREDKVPGNLTNFPVLISFSDPDIRTVAHGGGVESASGYDIVFSSSNNCGVLSQLDHQIEEYTSNVTTGTIVAWVKVPVISGTVNTEIYMYYGNSAQTVNLQNDNTFDVNHSNVYHFHNDFNDASSYSNNGTAVGTADQTNSIIADGETFSQNDYVQASCANMSAASGTFMAWARATSFSANHQYIVGHSTTPVYNNRYQLYTNDATGDLDFGMGSDHNEFLNIIDLNTAQWYHTAITWSGGNYTIYVNGTSAATGAYAAFTTLHTFLDIGNDGNAATRNEGWIGDLDEIQISNIVRSANWINTAYTNQVLPDSFFYVGTQLTNNCIALPVELFEFSATPIDGVVLLHWSTLTEINNENFTVDRSSDLKNWQVIGHIEGAGNSQSLLKYWLSDDDPINGTSYYRLSQTDYDGTIQTKDIAVVNVEGPIKRALFPNPNSGKFKLIANDVQPGSIQLFDVVGSPVSIAMTQNGDEYQITLDQVERGVYLLRYKVDMVQFTETILIE